MQALKAETLPIQHYDLWKKYEDTQSVDIRNTLITLYSPLVRQIALRTTGSYQYVNFLDDLINEGIIALLDAIEKFDLSKNVKFETFASIKIKGAMIDFIRRQDCFPRRVKRMAKVLAEAESDLCNKLEHHPSQQELADHLNMTVNELGKLQLEVYSLNVYSFEQVVYESNAENTLAELFTSHSDSPEQRLANQELATTVANAIESLKENEKLVIALHYKEQLKIKDIANILNISDSRVSQIHSNALKKLKAVIEQYITN
ncbi:FliA/WhiG family RNA polymerase sigma factor [Paludicola sp. MB14-C6]|uniref:sigma-70 family RNA polymerase sigma factor n=1 Tax=Paludihabitans sp. MB14-C6 TaxID=3070656 RepID=UPI0027DDF12C|nr:FliA/WhiG family RNA polymerase sigma factor [Paludicola sp. MB14-C6]WMJ24231.1 FliA/WhiG family RNA polymerase sigma factor [Paludicola sp. MB14-C6]